MGKKPSGMYLNKLGHIHNNSNLYGKNNIKIPKPIVKTTNSSEYTVAIDFAMRSMWDTEVRMRTRWSGGYPQMKLATSREATKATANLIAQDVFKNFKLLPDKVFESESSLTPVVIKALHKAEMMEEAKEEFMNKIEYEQLVSIIIWHSEIFLDAFPHYETMQELVG